MGYSLLATFQRGIKDSLLTLKRQNFLNKIPAILKKANKVVNFTLFIS